MKTLTLVILTNLLVFSLVAQTKISGIISDDSGTPLIGANVFIKGSYDGTAANKDGQYEFKTSLQGAQVLVATFIGYTTQEFNINITGETITQNFKLKDASNSIRGVVITAGTFETSERAQSVTLQPLDIVTTPSAAGDIYGALTTLPGTATVGEDGRLFVRGGDAYETKTFIDGLLVKKPYGSNVPDLPSRGRFSPFLFSGTTFSTGGYSAEYGQALSSALILTTNSFPQKTQTEVSIMSIGCGVTQTLKGERTSIAVGAEYMNLNPYYQVVPNRFEMNQYPESIGTTLSIRSQLTKEGVLKVFSTLQGSRIGLRYPSMFNVNEYSNVSVKNQNSYTNANFTDNIGNGWIMRTGVAFSLDNYNLDFENFKVKEDSRNLQVKASFKKSITDNMNILLGAEEVFNRFGQNYNESHTNFENYSSFDDYYSAIFAETEFRPHQKIAIRTGVRGEYSSILNDYNLAARLSAAYKLSTTSQVSLAYGNFFQTPEEQLLRFTNSLTFEQADHYILNYQWENNERILRIEGYVKDYKSLVTYNSNEFWNGDLYANSGLGYSQGVDLFFRDRKSFRTLDYWLSYSFVDSKRRYRDFPKMVTPHFAPKHTASFVAKQWVQTITTQFGVSATYSSGRPYNNPNSSKFMDGKTPNYNDISINASHLTRLFDNFTIIYLSVNNLLGRDNIFSYRYHSQPNANGIYEGFPIKADSKRFYFVGVFITI